MLSGLMGSVVQGMAFGTGSAVAHRAVDAVAGPRQMEVVHNNGDGTPYQGEQQQQQQPVQCADETNRFQSCLSENSNNFSSCQFYFDVLSQCNNNSKQDSF